LQATNSLGPNQEQGEPDLNLTLLKRKKGPKVETVTVLFFLDLHLCVVFLKILVLDSNKGEGIERFG